MSTGARRSAFPTVAAVAAVLLGTAAALAAAPPATAADASVVDWAGLQAAVGSPGTVTLAADISGTATLAVTGDVTIDLGDFALDIESASGPAIAVAGGTLTIVGRAGGLIAKGADGTDGAHGAHGEQGDQGDFGTRGGQGENGGTGGPGGPGKPGTGGDDGTAGAPAVDGAIRVLSGTVVLAGGNGGHGGDGGDGGQGGTGGRGGDGGPPTGGGAGGNGGNGGLGGDGGDGAPAGDGADGADPVDGTLEATGGRLWLIAGGAGWGGCGGEGGRAGDGGRGGSGGPGFPPGDQGGTGDAGHAGDPGACGSDGADGDPLAGVTLTGSYEQETPDPLFVIAGFLSPLSFETGGGTTVPTQQVIYGDLPEAPADPTRPGYVFAGWHLDAVDGPVWDPEARVFGPETVYAVWTTPAPPAPPALPATGDAPVAPLGLLAAGLLALGAVLLRRGARTGR